MAMKAIALGGTCTGEHGIGIGKKELLKIEMGQGAMNLMEVIKTAIDPLNIMNPGKVLDITTTTKNKKECCKVEGNEDNTTCCHKSCDCSKR